MARRIITGRAPGSRTLGELLLCALFLLLLAGSTRLEASGDTPVYDASTQTLTIPRIDVEGFGSLQVTLRLVDESSMTFSLVQAEEAGAGLSPGATFDLSSQQLAVPLANVAFEFYSLQFELVENDLFRLVDASTLTVTGQADYNALCASCHGIDGQGGLVAVSMVNCANCGSLETLSNYINNVMPLGGPDNCVDACAAEVSDYILNFYQVDNSPLITQTINAIESLDLESSLRKASMQLASRLPTLDEANLVNQNGEDGLREVLDSIMTEDAFYERLTEIFNDLLLTDRYLLQNSIGPEALNLMRPFPDAFWFDEGERNADFAKNLQLSNDSVAREPLELVNFVVRNELPMTEILTADYFVVNPYSAKSYGVFDNLSFTDEWDPNEWLPAQLDLFTVPHAGLLTSLMFLNRYPTSDTNRNRARSRVVYDLFLDVDILALEGTRPDGEAVDISSPAPTMDNDDCVICHGLLDPVASAFENWDARGFYRPFVPWYDDMFQAGFAGIDRPVSEEFTSVRWLASQMETDPRFNDAMLRIVYRGLVGREPLDPPGENGTAAEWDAYNAESVHLDQIKESFAADNQNLKTLIKEIILSPYWRASGLADTGFTIVHNETGAARLLSPEQLHRKIEALLGFQWRGQLDQYYITQNINGQARLLDDNNYYQQIYGGIDSFVVTERLTEPNGLMVAVQERLANELACYSVPNEFLASAEQRLLFPHVEMSTQPTSESNATAIRENIQHLHAHLLGENLASNDAEIDITYTLFTSVLSSGQAALGSTENTQLPALCRRNKDLTTGANLANPILQDPDYTLRAWIAVVAYLLSDYRFVYE
jgi:mono/diheme cytochrome c family protein